MEEQDETPTPTKKVGFFERRWRMVKAAAKQAYDYLFDVKTYVGAAVMLGGMALLDHYGVGEMVGVKSFLGMKQNPGPIDFAWRLGTLVGMSAAIRTGIGMAKESYACNDCHTGETAPDVGAGIKHALEAAQAAQKQFGSPIDHSQQFSPPTGIPAKPMVPGAAPPQLPR